DRVYQLCQPVHCPRAIKAAVQHANALLGPLVQGLPGGFAKMAANVGSLGRWQQARGVVDGASQPGLKTLKKFLLSLGESLALSEVSTYQPVDLAAIGLTEVSDRGQQPEWDRRGAMRNDAGRGPKAHVGHAGVGRRCASRGCALEKLIPFIVQA